MSVLFVRMLISPDNLMCPYLSVLFVRMMVSPDNLMCQYCLYV